MKNVMLAFGTRPETIKLAPVYHAMKRHPGLDVSVCLTGQHRDMLDQMTEFFEVPTDYDLNVMEPGQDLFDVTAKVLLGMRTVFAVARPDMVMVQGDTTTVMAVSMAAFYLRIPIAHVEAGLRTWDFDNPFPEEFNRWVADAASTLHFAPTEISRDALLGCGFSPETVHVTGNTVIDALFLTLDKLQGEPVRALDLDGFKKTVLLTTHRRESFGEPVRNTFKAVQALVKKYPALHFVFPAHPNPKVLEAIDECIGTEADRIHILSPQPYPEFVKLMRDCDVVLTDSGGVQEEAPSLGKPVLVLREKTERPEGVTAGTAKVVGTDPGRIVAEVSELIENENAYGKMATAVNPYGDGQSARKIADIVASTAQAQMP